MKSRIVHHIIIVLIIEITFIEAVLQKSKIVAPSNGPSVYRDNQDTYRQGSIDEFLALKKTTKNPNEYKPCIPIQYYPNREKRSLHFKNKILYPLYPVNVYQENINNAPSIASHQKPPYNAYGGYYCGSPVSVNHKPSRPIPQPVLRPDQQLAQNDLWSQLFSGFIGKNV